MTTRPRFTFRLLLSAFPTLGLLVMIATAPVRAQTFTVLHNFTGGGDGATPYAGVTIGGEGTLYGTTFNGGTLGFGVVYDLSHRSSGWTLKPLHEFSGGPNDGAGPVASPVIGPNGALYGSAEYGGSPECPYGCGTLFSLQPPSTICEAILCYWNETLIHFFQGNDGQYPVGNLVFDQSRNIYGVTTGETPNPCQQPECGTVFELTPSGGTWALSILYSFSYDGTNGYSPEGGVIFDTAGNLYGTTAYGGAGGCPPPGCGTAFELIPSGATWTENILFDFSPGGSRGSSPGPLVMDQSGNLYGTAYDGGTDGAGTVFELTPSNGSWIFSVLYIFNECSPPSGLTMDMAGNLYGVCSVGGAYGVGMVFELTNSNGFWTLADLHDFNGSDGGHPLGGVVFDNSGNLYGTTSLGGTSSNCIDGCGVVWEIAP